MVSDGKITVGVASCAGSSRPCGVCSLLGPVDNLNAATYPSAPELCHAPLFVCDFVRRIGSLPVRLGEHRHPGDEMEPYDVERGIIANDQPAMIGSA